MTKTGKYFRFDYRFQGKRKTLALGVYPNIKLQEARDNHQEARKLIRNDIDPVQYKKKIKNMQQEQARNNFESIAREWFIKYEPTWTKAYAISILRQLEINVFPWLGKQPISEISASEVLTVLKKMENRGVLDSAYRTKRTCGQIFRYGIATGRAERDSSIDLKGALPPLIQNIWLLLQTQERLVHSSEQ